MFEETTPAGAKSAMTKADFIFAIAEELRVNGIATHNCGDVANALFGAIAYAGDRPGTFASKVQDVAHWAGVLALSLQSLEARV